MHKLLQRQIERTGIMPEKFPEPLRTLLEAVDHAYRQADHDRSLLEHSLELTSRELVEQNQRLREQLAEQRLTEEALRQTEERYDLAVNGAEVGIWDWDLRSGMLFYSARWKSILGYGPGEFDSGHEVWLSHVHPDDRAGLEGALDDHLKGSSPRLIVEYRMIHRDGSQRWVQTCGIALRDKTGAPYRMAGSQTDITARKLAEERIRHDAIRDTLTGLPNRALLIDRLEHLMAHARREPQRRFAVLFIDLDRFKLINDSLGHCAGDNLLIEVARRLALSLKSSDTLARFGGDEFVLLLEEITKAADAVTVAKRLVKAMTEPFLVDNQEVYISVSIGIVISSPLYQQPDDMVRDADIAMYRAKAQGSGCYQLFDAEMHNRAIKRLRLESDLRKAIDARQFEIVYQPIYYLPNRQLTGFEALIRWRHPQRGLLSPAHFIPIAEEIGLIVPMDAWVLRQACLQMAEWQRVHPLAQRLAINVNLSARNFEQAGLSGRVRDILRESSLPPAALQLEITETSLMTADDTLIIDQLRQLRDLGAFLYLDDFGTGYASLSYLHRLPFNGLKIDRSFTAQLGDDPRKRAFVGTLITLAEQLYLLPVVEGIETERQLNEICSLSACCGQGFLFSPPLTAAEATTLVARQNTDESPPGSARERQA